MPLARIITRSQACSRQLAMDLLARGYTVEIVTPDRIPDNLADLELRVDEDPGNQLVATVQTNNGERSATLDFVHHLKAPMMDFIRRPPQPASRPSELLQVNAKPALGTAPTVPARPKSQPKPVAESATPMKEFAPPLTPANALPAVAESASKSIARPIPRLQAPVASTLPLISPGNSTAIPSASARPLPPLRQPAISPWRAAFALVSVLLLTALPWLALRPQSKIQVSALPPAQKAAASVASGPKPIPASTPIATAARASSPARISSQVVNAALDVPVTSPRTLRVTAKDKSHHRNPLRRANQHASPRHASPQNDDYVAPNTVIYLDPRVAAEAAARAKRAATHGAGSSAPKAAADLHRKPTTEESAVKPMPLPN